MANYDIKWLKKEQTVVEQKVRQHFLEFFRALKDDRNLNNSQSISKEIRTHGEQISLGDIEEIEFSGTAFYLILSNYQADKNECTYENDGLKAIYRGHASKVKRRLISHILNDYYWKNYERLGWERWTNSLKVDGKSGISIDKSPYKEHRWQVVVFKMSDSSALMREQAEQAFTEIFQQPLGSADNKRRNQKKPSVAVQSQSEAEDSSGESEESD